MAAQDNDVLNSLLQAAEALTVAAEQLAQAIHNGGRLVLLGSGTGGRLAIQEVSELPATFGSARIGQSRWSRAER